MTATPRTGVPRGKNQHAATLACQFISTCGGPVVVLTLPALPPVIKSDTMPQTEKG